MLERAAVAVIEPEALGRGERAHGNGEHRIDAALHREPAGVVDHADREGIRRRTVIGGKAAAARAKRVLEHHGAQRLEIVAACSLAQHDIHPARKLIERLLRTGALMVGNDAACNIGVEVRPGYERRMAVHHA